MEGKRKNPFLTLQLAVMLFGLSGVLSRSLTVSPVTIAEGRVLCSSVILFAILRFKGVSLSAESRRDDALTILAGLLLAVHWTAFFQSVQVASVAIGTITYATFPLFLLFLEPLLYHEKISLKNVLLAGCLLAGVLVTVPEFSLQNSAAVGVLWGMASSLTYAILTLCNRSLSRRYSGTWVSFREQLAAAVFLLPLMAVRHDTPDAKSLCAIGAIGVFCTAVAFSLFVSAQKRVSAQTAGISAGMETVYGIVFAAVFLRETPTARDILGGTIILTAAVASSLSERKSVS